MIPSEKNASIALLKYAPRLIGKQLPFGLGSLISLVSAGGRTLEGDLLGAGLDLGSAITSPVPFVGTATSAGLDLINAYRDLKKDDNSETTKIPMNSPRALLHEYNLKKISAVLEAPKSFFQKDLESPEAGLDSELYRAISPVIAGGGGDASSSDANRKKELNEDVRKGLLGLEYLTGKRQNLEPSFYDEHPVEAVSTALAKNAPVIGAGVAGTGMLSNFLRNWSNLRKTAPASMSRGGNPLDATNPARLLDDTSSRPDVARLFGDLSSDPAKRFALLDSLQPESEGFSSKYQDILSRKEQLAAEHAKSVSELQDRLKSELSAGKDPKAIQGMLDLQEKGHAGAIKNIENELSALKAQAKKSPAMSGLEKYVDLHESLRRAKEKGGLKGFHGEGAGAFGGVGDVLQRLQISGAHPNFNRELIKDIAKEYGGTKDLEKFINTSLARAHDPGHSSSGLRRALTRARGPLLAGTAVGLGGIGLYNLLKHLQEQNYSKEQIKDWKKTILKSRGEFDAAKELDKEEQPTE